MPFGFDHHSPQWALLQRSLKRARVALALVLALILIGMGGFRLFFAVSWSRALYLSIVTMTTLGDPGVVPHGVPQEAFIALLNLFGVSAGLYGLGVLMSTIVEGDLGNVWGAIHLHRALERIGGHYVVVGAGRVGERAARELSETNAQVVLIDRNAEALARPHKPEMLKLIGDATRDEVLLEAGITRAQGLLCTLPDDALNLVVVLTARELAPTLPIVARAEDPANESKLYHAGATRVILPALQGGRRMARAILHPNSMDFWDSILGHDSNFQLQELRVAPGAPLCQKRVRDIRPLYGEALTLIALRRGGAFLPGPDAEQVLQADDLILVLGTPEVIARIDAASRSA